MYTNGFALIVGSILAIAVAMPFIIIALSNLQRSVDALTKTIRQLRNFPNQP